MDFLEIVGTFLLAAVIGVLVTFLGALVFWWAADFTGIETLANLTYWQSFWTVFVLEIPVILGAQSSR